MIFFFNISGVPLDLEVEQREKYIAVSWQGMEIKFQNCVYKLHTNYIWDFAVGSSGNGKQLIYFEGRNDFVWDKMLKKYMSKDWLLSRKLFREEFVSL